jgi:hypothetical protein
MAVHSVFKQKTPPTEPLSAIRHACGTGRQFWVVSPELVP